MTTAISGENVTVYLRAMRRGNWSRNRHFEEHRTPTATRARRLFRLLQSIEQDVGRKGALISARRGDGKVTLWMKNEGLRLERMLRLSEEEFALLLDVSPALQQLLVG